MTRTEAKAGLILVSDFAEELNLECLVDAPRTEWDIPTPDLNRPGMQFCGFYTFFAFERPQVIGKTEMAYLDQLSPDGRREVLNAFFSYPIPCVVICRGLEAPEELLQAARKNGVHVFRYPKSTSKFTFSALRYLNRQLAPHLMYHGVLLDVYGIGVLLSGKSGVGKSEAALELVKRGHQLVADDLVDICRISDDRLIGTCPEKIRHLMEIRGIGIIDVRAMYGVGAVSVSKTIDLVIELENAEDHQELDRLGLAEHTIEILGVHVPRQQVPVRPGRNLAIIVETAARNLSLKRLGEPAAAALLSGIQPEEERSVKP